MPPRNTLESVLKGMQSVFREAGYVATGTPSQRRQQQWKAAYVHASGALLTRIEELGDMANVCVYDDINKVCRYCRCPRSKDEKK